MQFLRGRSAPGIATTTIVIVVVAIVIVGGLGGYYALRSASPSTSSSSTQAVGCSPFFVHVEDSSTGQAIPGASVLYGSATGVTDDQGNVELAVGGNQNLTISAAGYDADEQATFAPVTGYNYSYALVPTSSSSQVLTTSATTTAKEVITSCPLTTSSQPGTTTTISLSRSTTSATPSTATSTQPSTTTTGYMETFTGNFEWMYTSNGTNGASVTVIKASGTFTVTIDLTGGSGIGNGQGYATLDLSGGSPTACTGMDSLSYTFVVFGQLIPPRLYTNLTLDWTDATPMPGTFTQTCTSASGSSSGAADWPTFQAVFPADGISVRAAPGQTVEGTMSGADFEDQGTLTYEVTIL